MAPAFWPPFSSAPRGPASSPEHQQALRRPEGSPSKASAGLAADETTLGGIVERSSALASPSGFRQGQQQGPTAGDRPSSDPTTTTAGALSSRPPALSLDRLPFKTGSLALSSATRSASSDSEQSSTRTDDADEGNGTRLSAASSVSSLHASDDGRSVAAGLDHWLKDAIDGRPSSLAAPSVTREEATPRAERPPVLQLTTAATTVDATSPGISSGYVQADLSCESSCTVLGGPLTFVASLLRSTSPSYFPSPTDSSSVSSSAADKRGRIVSPPPASRSPSYPPPSAASRPISSGRSSSIDAPQGGEHPSWRSSVFSTSSSSGASFSTAASSSISSQYGLSSSFGSMTSAGGGGSSSSSACSVSTPVLPRPWLASDQLLTKAGPVDDMRDEAALLVETTDESYVVVACLPGFSCVLSSATLPCEKAPRSAADLARSLRQARLHHTRDQVAPDAAYRRRPLGALTVGSL